MMRKQTDTSQDNVINLRQHKILASALKSSDVSQVPADAVIVRGVFMDGSITMDDGRRITTWGFTDGQQNASTMPDLPSPAIRVRQGQMVETHLLNTMTWQHGIKHHGVLQELLKPETVESDENFHVNTYRWQAIQPGTFFYYCDSSTLLHREMGMYGALIIDPPAGTGTLYASGPTYDHEFVWICDEIDSTLHRNAIDALVLGGKAGFNPPRPDYFVINGVDGTRSTLKHPSVSPTIKLGERLLIRYICAGYLAQRVHFDGLKADIHMANGCILPNAVSTSSIEAMPSECYDCIIQADRKGTFEINVEFLHWKTGQVMGRARTHIHII